MQNNNKEPKRKKGDGNFKKLENGTHEFTVSNGYDENGKRIRLKFYGKTQGECRKLHKQYLIEGDKSKAAPVLILADWIDRWLSTYKANKVEASSYEGYQNLADHVKRHRIGGMKLTQIKSEDITEFFGTAINDYSHSFRKRMKFLLKGAFERAIDNDYCTKNPVKFAEIADVEQTEREAFTEPQTGAIVDFAKTDELFGVAVYIMFNTGIRSGEMRALSVDRVDLENGVITVDRACKRTEELGKPKNNKTRYIPLEDDVVEFLREKLSGKSGFIVGGGHYVSRAGFRSRYLHFFNRLNKHLEATGAEPIPYKSAHSTRHTFGTLRQKHGMPLAMVSALLGHSSTDVTDKYTHLSDVETLSEAVRKYPLSKLLA